MTSEDIKHQFIIITPSAELRSCVKVEVAVLGCPSLIVLLAYVDVKQHWRKEEKRKKKTKKKLLQVPNKPYGFCGR